MIELQKIITCGICGKEDKQAMLLGFGSKMCNDCYSLFSAAISPKVSVQGFAHPAVGTYYHDPNCEAIKIWEEHMLKCGFTRTKSGRWRNKNAKTN